MLRRDFLKVGGFALATSGLYLQREAIAIPRGAVGAFGLGGAFETKVYTGITLKMATVASGAFITQVSGSIPWALYINRSIAISDGTNTTTGYVKAVGITENLSVDEKVANPSFTTNTTNWASSRGTIASVAGGQSGNCLELTYGSGSNCYAYSDDLTLVVGALYKYQAYVKSGTSGNDSFSIREGYSGTQLVNGTTSASWVLQTAYYTPTGATRSIQFWKTTNVAGTMLFDEASVKKVLAPDSTGITISSTRGGATQSWTSNGGIDEDAASFTVTVSR